MIEAWESGFIESMDTTALGWAVQRLGAGREKAGEPVDAHAGIEFHARRGARVEKGQPLATLYATSAPMLPEPVSLFVKAVTIGPAPPNAAPLVSRIFARESAEDVFARCCKVVVSYQLSAISCQWSVVSYQLSVVSDQWSAGRGQRSAIWYSVL